MFPFILFGAAIAAAIAYSKSRGVAPSPRLALIRAQLQAHLNGLASEEGQFVLFDIDDKTGEVMFVGSYDTEQQAKDAVKEVGEGMARLYVDRQKGLTV
jgi:hypothetical protein